MRYHANELLAYDHRCTHTHAHFLVLSEYRMTLTDNWYQRHKTFQFQSVSAFTATFLAISHRHQQKMSKK